MQDTLFQGRERYRWTMRRAYAKGARKRLAVKSYLERAKGVPRAQRVPRGPTTRAVLMTRHRLYSIPIVDKCGIKSHYSL